MSAASQYGYSTLADVQTAVGTAAVNAWSATEGGGYNDARMQQCFNFSDSEIIRTFLDIGNLVSPLQPLGADVNTVKEWSIWLTVDRLYFLRGTQDDGPGNRFARQIEAVRLDMQRAVSGGARLLSARRWPAPTVPTTGF